MPKAVTDADDKKEIYDVVIALKVFLKVKFTSYETLRTKGL